MTEQEVSTDEIINNMRDIDPIEFEQLVADLWEYLGYNTEVSKASSDRGVDVTATREFPYEEKILIQAKRYSSTVSGPELREYIALAKRDDVDSVIVISTSEFTKQAKQEAEEYNVKLINGETLAQMLISENAVDLVREYVGEIESADIEQKRPPEQSTSTVQEIQTTVGEGEFLSMEVVGYGHRDLTFSLNDVIYEPEREETELKESTIICLSIKNKSKSGWSFRAKNDLSVTSVEGFSHDSARKCVNHFDSPLAPWNNGYDYEIPRDSKSRIAVVYATKLIPKKITYEAQLGHHHGDVEVGNDRFDDKEKITVPIDDSVRDNLDSLPDSISFESAYFR